MNSPPDKTNGRHDGQDTSKPSTAARWFLNTLVVVVTATIIGGIWWRIDDGLRFLNGQPKRSQQQVAADSPNGTPDEDRSAGNGNSHTHDEENHTDFKTSNKTYIDFTQTSWQNPFSVAHWESNGWTIQADSMLSSGAETTMATFRRRYRKLSVDCRVAPVGKPDAFEISLFAPETNALIDRQVHCGGGG